MTTLYSQLRLIITLHQFNYLLMKVIVYSFYRGVAGVVIHTSHRVTGVTSANSGGVIRVTIVLTRRVTRVIIMVVDLTYEYGEI